MMVWERRLQRHLREHILGYAFTAVLLLGAFIRYSSMPQMAADLKYMNMSWYTGL